MWLEHLLSGDLVTRNLILQHLFKIFIYCAGPVAQVIGPRRLERYTVPLFIKIVFSPERGTSFNSLVAQMVRALH